MSLCPQEVMSTALSRDEFAAALGMREGDLFVRKMFKIVDKDSDGRISFQVDHKGNCVLKRKLNCLFLQEFLDTVVLFSTTGRSEDKLRYFIESTTY